MTGLHRSVVLSLFLAFALVHSSAAQCTAPIDLVFALDASWSVGSTNYKVRSLPLSFSACNW